MRPADAEILPAASMSMRLMLAENELPAWREHFGARRGARCAAALFDGAAVAAVTVVAALVVGRFWMPLAAAVLSYFTLGTLLVGSSPGAIVLPRIVAGHRARSLAARSRGQEAQSVPSRPAQPVIVDGSELRIDEVPPRRNWAAGLS